MHVPEDTQAAFLVCTFSMLGKLAEADGRVSGEEVQKVEQFAKERLRLDRRMRRMAMDVFQDAIESPLSLRDYAEKFLSTYQDQVQIFDSTVESLLELSVADGYLDPREEELIRSTALVLGLTEPGYERIKKQVLERRII